MLALNIGMTKNEIPGLEGKKTGVNVLFVFFSSSAVPLLAGYPPNRFSEQNRQQFTLLPSLIPKKL